MSIDTIYRQAVIATGALSPIEPPPAGPLSASTLNVQGPAIQATLANLAGAAPAAAISDFVIRQLDGERY
jgi:hypothetical protein